MILQKNVLDIVFHARDVQPVDVFPDHIKHQRKRIPNFDHVNATLLQVELVIVD